MFPRYFSGEITNWPRLPCYSLKDFHNCPSAIARPEPVVLIVMSI